MGSHKGGSIKDKTSTLEDLEARIQEAVNDRCWQRDPLRHPADGSSFHTWSFEETGRSHKCLYCIVNIKFQNPI